jgi:hypothetical protein
LKGLRYKAIAVTPIEALCLISLVLHTPLVPFAFSISFVPQKKVSGSGVLILRYPDKASG